MAGTFTSEENQGLKELFGTGLHGAEEALRRNPLVMPRGVTEGTLKRYKKIAEDAIQEGKDKTGVQEKRLEIIEKLLP